MIRGHEFPPPTVAKYYLSQATVTYGFLLPVCTPFLLYRILIYARIGLCGSISASTRSFVPSSTTSGSHVR